VKNQKKKKKKTDAMFVLRDLLFKKIKLREGSMLRYID